MADLNSSNSFDSNMGSGLGPAYASESHWDCDLQVSAFTSINGPGASTRTVSPKDIFHDPLGSVPPSTTFTDLTSPEMGESPFITDSYETSPMFYGDAVGAPEAWYPLFPQADAESAKPVLPVDLERTVSTNSLAQSSSSSNSPIVLDSTSRRRSSTARSPALNASISKPRRRKDQLPPIAVDPSDKVAMKRARNTLAARDSRQRKYDHVQSLERRNAELETELEKWKNIAFAHGYTET